MSRSTLMSKLCQNYVSATRNGSTYRVMFGQYSVSSVTVSSKESFDRRFSRRSEREAVPRLCHRHVPGLRSPRRLYENGRSLYHHYASRRNARRQGLPLRPGRGLRSLHLHDRLWKRTALPGIAIGQLSFA